MTLCILLMSSLLGCKEMPNGKLRPETIKDSSSGLRNKLIGKWGGLGESKPVFEIRKDSICYFQQSTKYPYKIVNHDFVIFFPDHEGILRNIRVDHDTIFFYDDYGLKRGYR